MIAFRAILIAFRASPRAALAALWARARGLRVRARNIIYAAAHQNPDYYPLWVSVIEPGKVEIYCQETPSVEKMPPIVALVFGGDDGSLKDTAQTVRSMSAAFGDAATIFCDVSNAGIRLNCRELSKGTIGDLLAAAVTDSDAWLLPMIAGDEISPHACKAIASALASSPDAAILYWDEDRLDGRQRHDPWLKPNWDELLFLARDFLTGAGLFKMSQLFALNGSHRNMPIAPRTISQAVTDFVSRTGGKPTAFHIPLILSHRRAGSIFATAAERKAVIQAAWHEPIELAEIAGLPETLRPRFMAGTSLPKVSIIVPTRNRHELLSVCMAGLAHVEYGGEIEIIVIDNESDDRATLEYLERLECEGTAVIRHPGPFNFSAMNNQAARIATGELLCLLNNDIEMHDGIWLDAMVRHAMRPGIGAVGALLQYPDRTVQHAGVSIGTGGAAGHVYRGTPVSEAGHRDMHRLTRRVSAVTAACLVVRREAFMEVGGLDETAFKVAFNDVDLCLKLARNGYRNVLAGEAKLTHHESKSRGSDFSGDNYSRYLNELTHLQDKWGTKEFVDPYHHPLAMRSSEKFVLTP